MKTEKQLQNYLKKKCAEAGVLCYKFSSPAKRGVPDIVLVKPGGGVIFVELKSPAGTGFLSPLQKREIAILRKQAASVCVAESKLCVDNLMYNIARGYKC